MSENYYSKGQDIHFVMTTPEEEKSLFLAARGGCEKSRTFLIHNHLLFAAMQAQAQVKGKLPKDEVISAANFAVMKAMDSFDPNRGFRFTTYLRPFIRGAVSELWKSKFSGGVIDPSVNQSSAPLFTPSVDPSLNVPDNSPTVEELNLADFNRECLARALATLNKKDAELIRLRYVEGWTLTAIGRKRKVSREAIRNAHVRIVRSLKFALKREGFEG